MTITFTDRGGEFFAFNFNHLKRVSCYLQQITIEDKNGDFVRYAVPEGEVKKVQKQLEKIAENA
jgi:hypothetical protein